MQSFLSAFAGVCPQQRLSSTSVKGRTMVSKRGHADLRKARYMQGRAMRFNPQVQDMAQRMDAKGMAPKAIIAAAMHKLVHLIYGLLKTRKPFDVNWAKAATNQFLWLCSHQKIVFLRLTFKTVSDLIFAFKPFIFHSPWPASKTYISALIPSNRADAKFLIKQHAIKPSSVKRCNNNKLIFQTRETHDDFYWNFWR